MVGQRRTKPHDRSPPTGSLTLALTLGSPPTGSLTLALTLGSPPTGSLTLALTLR
jgi:hypothetical protein